MGQAGVRTVVMDGFVEIHLNQDGRSGGGESRLQTSWGKSFQAEGAEGPRAWLVFSRNRREVSMSGPHEGVGGRGAGEGGQALQHLGPAL